MNRGSRSRIVFHAALVAAFVVGFVQYGFHIEDAHAGPSTYRSQASGSQAVRAPRAGDVYVQNAAGKWVLERSAGRTTTVPIASRPVGPRPSVVPSTVMPSTLNPSIGNRPLSAAAFARMHNMTWKDHGTYGVMQDGTSRIRLYPNSRHAVVMNKRQQLRQPVTRRNAELMLPACVANFLSASTSSARQRQWQLQQQRQAAVASSLSRPVVIMSTPSTPATVHRHQPVFEPIYKSIAKRAVLKTPKAPVAAPVRSTQGSAGWAPAGVTERKWKWIILHHSDDTSGNAAKYDRVHRYDNGWEHGLGYHFVVGNGSQSGDGEVEIGPRWQKQLHGAHAKTPDNCYNDHGVGICLVGNFDVGSGRPTGQQMRELVRLVRWLQERYGISKDKVRGHCDCCPTACPGKNFPWGELRAQLR